MGIHSAKLVYSCYFGTRLNLVLTIILLEVLVLDDSSLRSTAR